MVCVNLDIDSTSKLSCVLTDGSLSYWWKRVDAMLVYNMLGLV